MALDGWRRRRRSRADTERGRRIAADAGIDPRWLSVQATTATNLRERGDGPGPPGKPDAAA